MIRRDWHKTHGQGWTGIIIPDSFAHPAKFSRALIRRIYRHAIEQGWLKAGDIVCDPFAGVALGALHAMQNGLGWIGVELEEKFMDLGRQNLDLWNERYATLLPGWGGAMLLQGDSRRLCEMVGKASAVISSPPYTSSLSSDDPDKRGGLFRDPKRRNDRTLTAEYGDEEGQLGTMPEGNLDAVVGSPPYAQHGTGHDGAYPRLDDTEDARREQEGCRRRPAYGRSEGQLTRMSEGNLNAVVSSPPYVSAATLDHGIDWEKAGRPDRCKPSAARVSPETDGGAGYGETEGQLGQSSGDTFWSASRQIMKQVHALLRPGGVAIWVCKRFIRKGQIVEFSQQWARLGLACGFEPLEWIRAWLIEERANVTALFDFEVETEDKNGDVTKRTVQAGERVRYENKQIKDPELKRIGFFRRLAERKGAPPIDYEDVIVQRKPMRP